jgi:hypothetical protein
MRKIILICFFLTGAFVVFSQTKDLPENTGDHFSLEGALELFKKANSLEEFERSLNEERNNVNNLDLNDDQETDYILVEDIQEGDVHMIVLGTYLNETEKQDIATIGIEKTGNESAILQIEGDPELYEANTILEPSETQETFQSGKGGPYAEAIISDKQIVNVWFWPGVRFLYSPGYVMWRSPWRWKHYPNWWKPWRPLSFRVFYGRGIQYRSLYRRASIRRVTVAHRIYAPRRKHSTIIVHRNRRTGIIKPGNRKAVILNRKNKAIRKRRNQ